MTNENLLILPFDHRSSFSKKIMGYKGKLTPEQTEKVKELKQIVFDAFLSVRDQYDNKDMFGILVDEQFGIEIIQKAKELGIKHAVAVEKSGQDTFAFEHGGKFKRFIKDVTPTYVKALVRYNPDNTSINKKQLKKLEKLSDFCQESGNKLLFELLVPASDKDQKDEEAMGDYDLKIRPTKTVKAIEEIKERVNVDVWKIEGLDKGSWPKILETVGESAKVIVLGRGADNEQVKSWLTDAAGFEKVIGFAVGRTIFSQSLIDYKDRKIDREQAKTQIADNFRSFVDLWLTEREKLR